MSIRVGIAGVRGLSVVQALRDTPGVEVTALCDLDAAALERAASRWEIPLSYRIYGDMLAGPIDAVIVATPMQLHVQQTIEALHAGKHVLSEVTAGCSMDELFWLVEEVEGSGLVYMMAENYIYTPEMQQVIAMAAAGCFGSLYYGEGEYLHNLDNILTYPDGRPSWRRWWQLGTRGLFYPTHSLGPLMKCFAGDRIESLVAMGSGWHTRRDLRQEDTSVALLRLASGGMIRLRVDCISRRPHAMNNHTLQGTAGVYESPRTGGEHVVSLIPPGENVDDATWQPLSDYAHYLPERYRNAPGHALRAGHGGGDYFIVQDFIDAVRGLKPPAIDVYEACEWTAVGLLSSLSVSNGSRLMLMPDFRSRDRRDQITIL